MERSTFCIIEILENCLTNLYPVVRHAFFINVYYIQSRGRFVFIYFIFIQNSFFIVGWQYGAGVIVFSRRRDYSVKNKKKHIDVNFSVFCISCALSIYTVLLVVSSFLITYVLLKY